MKPPKVFETERLILRYPTQEDAAPIFNEYAQDPEVTKFLTWKTHTKIEDAYQFIEKCQQGWNDETVYNWVIVLKETNQPIGMLSARNGKFKTDIGYALSRHYWGRGIMTEAGGIFMNWAQSQPSIFRVWAFHDIENLSSGRVLEKIGMKKEVILKNWSLHPNISLTPRDSVVYAWNRMY